ncbi:peptidase M23 [Gramella sp. AN32]|nr:peptidase M23 [Gramella sp. AN32]
MRIPFLLSILAILNFASCSKIEKAANALKGLSEKEQYREEHEISEELYNLWISRIDTALGDNIEIELPYQEFGELQPRSFSVYSYNTYLMTGEVLEIEMDLDSLNTLVFLDVYKQNGAQKTFNKIESAKAEKRFLNFEAPENALYKIVIQPEIEAHSPFHLKVQKSPAYIFPVANGKNGDIGSYWGDARGGGERNHEGIDIFAKKGTPVVASVNGRVGFTGEKGLGGKQVWLRDSRRRQSLYYAHLDSIMPNLGRVKIGDTLGFVGNTGNARTTPSHLHFGIYKRATGAIDPLGFVYKTDSLQEDPYPQTILDRLVVGSTKANFRNKPSTMNSKILRNGTNGEKLRVQGIVEDWYHVRDSLDKSLFIHQSLVGPAG